MTRSQTGMALIEALVAVLVFAVGVLALIGMQSLAVKTGTDAKYRSDAAYLASQLISQMWADTRANLPLYAHNQNSACVNGREAACAPTCTPSGNASTYANVTTWLNELVPPSQASPLLPGATSSLVTISVVPIVANGSSVSGTNTYGNSYLVAITLCWQLPEDKSASPVRYRQYVTAAQIS